MKPQWKPLVSFASKRDPSNIYTVSLNENGDGQEFGCDCPGWRFRRTCNHVRTVEEQGLDAALAIAGAGQARLLKLRGVLAEAREQHAIVSLDQQSTDIALSRFLALLDRAGLSKSQPAARARRGARVMRMISLDEDE